MPNLRRSLDAPMTATVFMPSDYRTRCAPQTADVAGVQCHPGVPGTEFAWIVVTDDGFSVSRYPLDVDVDVTRQFQPAPVAVRAQQDQAPAGGMLIH